MLSGAGDNFGYAVGLFEEHKDEDGDIEPTFVARLSYAPVLHDNFVVHLGAAWLVSDHSEGTVAADSNSSATAVVAANGIAHTFGDIGFRALGSEGTGHVSPYAFAYDGYQGYSLELGVVNGPLHLRAEYMDFSYDDVPASRHLSSAEVSAGNYVNTVRPHACPTANLSGGGGDDLNGLSLLFAFTLTGETREYDVANGYFRRPKAGNHFGGSWELFWRHAMLESDNDRALCDRYTHEVVGVNWHPNDNIRVQLNMSRIDIGNRSRFSATEGESSGDVLGLRLQYAF